MVSLSPSRLTNLEERRELPQWGPGRSLCEKHIWCILSVTKHFYLQYVVNVSGKQNDIIQRIPIISQKTFPLFFEAWFI